MTAPVRQRRIPWAPARGTASVPKALRGTRRVRRRLARDGDALLQQQLWCLGADIKRCEGNLLLAYGCERARPAPGEPGSSCYVHAGRVGLWGFGAWYAEPGAGSIVLRRYAFRPKWAPAEVPPATHTVEQFGAWHLPADRAAWAEALRLTAGLCDWFAAYERWVGTVDADWRRRVLADWDTPLVDAAGAAAAWADLAERLRYDAAA